MATVSGAFRRAWRSKRYVGANRPVQVVKIRPGRFRRRFAPWEGHDVHAAMPGRSETEPWQAFWEPEDEWRELPNVLDVSIENDFTSNGISHATIQIDNVYFEEHVPPAAGPWSDGTTYVWDDGSPQFYGPNFLVPGQLEWMQAHATDRDTSSYGAGYALLTADPAASSDFPTTAPELTGLFHRILRGFFAPARGYRVQRRPKAPAMAENEWFRYLDRANQITVFQGYGDELVETWTGLTDQIDLRSLPDEVTITARDFGQTLTDQRNLGKARDKALGGNPTVFAPMKEWDRPFSRKHTKEAAYLVGTAGNTDASSWHHAHTPHWITRRRFTDSENFWQSAHKPGPDEGGNGKNNTEWVQIHLPAGRYRSFYIDPAYGGMEMWVSIYARKRNINTDTKTCKVDGDRIPDGWIDLDKGVVPGEAGQGGEPWVKHFRSLGLRDREYKLGHEIELGDDSLLRVSFRNLRHLRIDGKNRWAAGVRSLFGVRERKHPHDRPKHDRHHHDDNLIYVKDVSDMVKVALRWAGFKEWDVESTGMELPKHLTFHNGDMLIDIIKKAQELTNYVFFMGDPSGDTGASSIGVPVFRQARITSDEHATEQLRDKDLLTGVQVKWDRTPLMDPIYVRGKQTKSIREGGKGRNYGEDHNPRIQALYRPPWRDSARSGGLLRHFVAKYEHLRTHKECRVAAQMIGVNMALQSATAIIEFPANPAVEMDSHVGVLDTGTGLNTRVYVSNRSSHFHAGEETEWTMTIGGALVDSPDVVDALADLHRTLKKKEDKDASRAIGGDQEHRPHRGRIHPRQHRPDHVHAGTNAESVD